MSAPGRAAPGGGLAIPVIVTLAFAQALSTASEGPPAKPLPGNEPCAFPAAAARQFVAGTVSFVARVTPEGRTESVEIRAVPQPDLEFEEAVQTCLRGWRFEPADAGERRMRPYEGRVRYTIAPAEEGAVRQLLETLSAAWNADDREALEALESRRGEVPTLPTPRGHFLREQIQAAGGTKECRLRLDPDLTRLRYLLRDLVDLTQAFACAPVVGEGAAPSPASVHSLDLTAVKGPRGWRFVAISEADKAWLGVRRVQGLREPRKVKSVNPVYPEIARRARVQGVIILECIISREGKVASIRVLRGIPLLDAAAIEAVRQWEYTPTLVDGQPVPVIMTVTVNFKLS
jgi:TonB family protein